MFEFNEEDNLGRIVVVVDSLYSLPFIDDFDRDDKPWTTMMGYYELPQVWQHSSGYRHRIHGSHSGDKSWHTSVSIKHDPASWCGSPCNDQYLVSPFIDLTSDTNDLVISHWYKLKGSSGLNYYLEYNTGCNTNGWGRVDTLFANRDLEWDFNNARLDHVNTNDNIRFRFKYISNYSNPEGLNIDDVYIGAAKSDLSIERKNLNLFTLPSISSDTLSYYLNNSGYNFCHFHGWKSF